MAFASFYEKFDIKHTTSIPHNSQGQAIMEQTHQILKNQIIKLQQGEFKYVSPHHILSHALFVINHLNLNPEGISPMSLHWELDKSKQRPMVRWKVRRVERIRCSLNL